jgi:hypothetical protein
VVLGFRPHTYWTAVVALSGDVVAPTLVDRRRIDFAAGDQRFVYHQAVSLSPAKAVAKIQATRRAVETAAAQGVKALLAGLAEAPVRLAVVPVGRPPAQDLAEIIRSHAAIHAAEGQFYRDALAEACRALGLDVARVAEKELLLEASRTLQSPAAKLEAHLKVIGGKAGPPWGEDQRMAALAAWIGLADLAN